MALLIQSGPCIEGEESQYSVGSVLLSLGFQLHVGLFHDMGIVIVLQVGGSVAEQLKYWDAIHLVKKCWFQSLFFKENAFLQ